MEFLSILSNEQWLIVIFMAVFSGFIHGSIGLAGGLLMTAVLTQIIGIQKAVVVMTGALIISHFSRVVLFWKETDLKLAQYVLFFGAPMIVLGAIIFSYLNSTAIALIFATFLVISIPVKNWARKSKIQTSKRVLAGASAIWGMLAGNVIGPGFFLTPFLQGLGINRLTYVGTLATITLSMNIIKLTVFSATQLTNISMIMLGIVIGFVTIPGNWAGRNVLRKLDDNFHRKAIDIFTLVLICYFLYTGFVS